MKSRGPAREWREREWREGGREMEKIDGRDLKEGKSGGTVSVLMVERRLIRKTEREPGRARMEENGGEERGG